MSAPAILCHTRPPAKRKQWSNRHMEEAMKAVQKGDIGINQAAREYGVPLNSSRVTPPGATSNPVTSTGSKSNQIGDRSSETSTVVSKYLVTPSDTPSTKRSLPRARLLTSASVLAALEEKERNKRQAIEEKEKRKIEREQKKKQREEQLKLKAEEKARKAAETAEKAKKASERERAKRDKQSKASAPKSASAKRKLSSPSPEETSEVPRKKTRVRQYTSETIDTNVCCTCFRTYDEDVLEETGADWIACACEVVARRLRRRLCAR